MSSHIFEKGEFHEAELNNNDGDRCSLLHIRFPVCPNKTRIVTIDTNVLTSKTGSASRFWINEIQRPLPTKINYKNNK